MPATAFYPPAEVQPQVREYLQNPTEIRADLEALVARRTIADYAFSQGPANNGAVVYDEITGERVEGERQAEVIAPGAEFPRIDDANVTPRTAKVDKYGGEAAVTQESRDWNEWDVVNQKLRMLRNKVITRVNAVAVNALRANSNVRTYGVSTAWGGSGADPIGDILRAKALVASNENLPYEATLALIHPEDKAEFLLTKAIREQFPREARDLNPVLDGEIDRIGGLEWISSPAVERGTIWEFERGTVGSIRDAGNGIQTEVYTENKTQSSIIQAWRHIVPIINNPKAAVKITGFRE